MKKGIVKGARYGALLIVGETARAVRGLFDVLSWENEDDVLIDGGQTVNIVDMPGKEWDRRAQVSLDPYEWFCMVQMTGLYSGVRSLITTLVLRTDTKRFDIDEEVLTRQLVDSLLPRRKGSGVNKWPELAVVPHMLDDMWLQDRGDRKVDSVKYEMVRDEILAYEAQFAAECIKYLVEEYGSDAANMSLLSRW